jgi:hypothetical protein
MGRIEILDKLIEFKWWTIERRLEVKDRPDSPEYQTWSALRDQIKATIEMVQEEYDDCH